MYIKEIVALPPVPAKRSRQQEQTASVQMAAAVSGKGLQSRLLLTRLHVLGPHRK